MTRVEMKYSVRSLCLTIKGHAEREPDGEPILCAKVTILGQQAEEACRRLFEEKEEKVSVVTSDGYRKVEAEWGSLWRDEKERLLDIFETIRAGFEIVADQYEGKIHFAYENFLAE